MVRSRIVLIIIGCVSAVVVGHSLLRKSIVARLDPTVVFQSTQNGCAPACLTMVLRARGVQRSADSVFNAFALSHEGASVTEVVRVARSFGLEASAWRLPAEALSVVTLPAMLLIDEEHFVVLDSVRGDVSFVRDPARGADRIPMTALLKRWKGVIVRFDAASPT